MSNLTIIIIVIVAGPWEKLLLKVLVFASSGFLLMDWLLSTGQAALGKINTHYPIPPDCAKIQTTTLYVIIFMGVVLWHSLEELVASISQTALESLIKLTLICVPVYGIIWAETFIIRLNCHSWGIDYVWGLDRDKLEVNDPFNLFHQTDYLQNTEVVSPHGKVEEESVASYMPTKSHSLTWKLNI